MIPFAFRFGVQSLAVLSAVTLLSQINVHDINGIAAQLSGTTVLDEATMETETENTEPMEVETENVALQSGACCYLDGSTDVFIASCSILPALTQEECAQRKGMLYASATECVAAAQTGACPSFTDTTVVEDATQEPVAEPATDTPLPEDVPTVIEEEIPTEAIPEEIIQPVEEPVVTPQPPAEELPDTGNFDSSDLVGAWSFDGGPGSLDIADASGNGNKGNLEGANIANGWSTDVPPTKYPNLYSLQFNGVSDSVALGSIVGLDTKQGTVAVWMKANNVDDFGFIFSHITIFNNHRIYMAKLRENFHVGLGDKDGIRDTGYDFSAGEWTHIVLSWDNGIFSAYADGRKLLSGSYTNLDTVGRASIGAFPLNKSANFNGLIDDVRLYKRALSDCEVKILADGRSNLESCT